MGRPGPSCTHSASPAICQSREVSGRGGQKGRTGVAKGVDEVQEGAGFSGTGDY